MEVKFDVKKKKLHSISIIAFIAFVLILSKWSISYITYPNESLLNKIIFDLQDHLYFPFIINLLNFDLNPDYLGTFVGSKIIPMPIYSVIFHSAIYSIFSEYSFIILEYFSVFLFLYIFFKIFKELNITDYISIIFSIIIFLLPDFFIHFNKISSNLINFNSLQSLYSFRFPRPLISNIYFFWGILLAIYFYKDQISKNKIFIYIGISLGLNFGSVYYNFVILCVLFLILFFFKIFNKNKFYFLKLIKKIIISIVFFIFFALPFIIILFYSEPDYAIKVGTLHLNYEKKIYLINYLLSRFFSLKFIILFATNSFLLFFLLKSKNFYCNNTLIVLYLLFISSIISPIIFILFSPVISEIYHFLDLIVAISILIFVIFIILIISKFYMNKIKSKKFNSLISNNNIFFALIVLFLVVIFNVNYLYKYNKHNYNGFRQDIVILNNFLSTGNNYDTFNNILAFNTRIQTWWILKDKKKLTTVDSIFSSLNFDNLELSFLNNIKYLGISKNNFIKLIKNKKTSWRYVNRYVAYFSTYKYQANALTTYKDSLNFDSNTLNYIKNSSPTKTQQIIIPKNEVKRLADLFDTIKIPNIDIPDMIILERKSPINKYSAIDLEHFCKLDYFNFIEIYINKNKAKCL